MVKDYKNDRLFPLVKRMIMHHKNLFDSNVLNATLKQDQQEGFDLVLSFASGNIAVRLRKNKYFFTYRDFTVRYQSNNPNAKTEIHKIIEGCADYYFYGWESQDGTRVEYYMILGLDMFRIALIDDPPREPIKNYDGTSFLHYDLPWLVRNDVILYKNFLI